MKLSLNIDDDTGRILEQKAREQGLGIQVFLQKIIKQITAGEPSYHDLDGLAGTWSEKETSEFMDSIADFGKIDREVWR